MASGTAAVAGGDVGRGAPVGGGGGGDAPGGRRGGGGGGDMAGEATLGRVGMLGTLGTLGTLARPGDDGVCASGAVVLAALSRRLGSLRASHARTASRCWMISVPRTASR